jgi:transcriptional regulator with XRE-family HTH domain
MTPEELKKLLKKAGTSQKKIADALDVSRPTIHYTVTDRSRSRRIEDYLAKTLGMAHADIFPIKLTK